MTEQKRPFEDRNAAARHRRLVLFFTLASLTLALAGCGLFSSGEPEEATPESEFALVPTFTPTAVIEAAAPTEAPTLAPTEVPPPDATAAPAEEPATVTQPETEQPIAEEAELPPAATPPTSSQVIVAIDQIDIRGGPGTEYAVVGSALRDEAFDLTGRNQAGDWWQFCCVNEQIGWVYAPLVRVENADSVAVAADIPPPPEPVAVAAAPVETQPEPEPTAEAASTEEQPPAPALVPGQPLPHSGSTGNLDPNAQYHIVSYRMLGKDENNGGIAHGGQHHIFVTVLDEGGGGVHGAVIKDAIDDNLDVVTGAKGPGKAEIAMYGQPWKLYVHSDSSGPVTSQVSNILHLTHPHLPDVVGKLGDVCPTLDDCETPIYLHFSYEIIFQKVR